MPIPYPMASRILETIREESNGRFGERLRARLPHEQPLPPAVPADGAHGSRRADRRGLLRAQGHPLPAVTGERTVTPEDAFRGNVENFIGVAQVPIGLVGPLRINGLFAHGDFYVPLATSEGTLVASHARGAAALSQAGGARALCLAQRVCRAPVFRFATLVDAGAFLAHVLDLFPRLPALAAETTRHGRLEDVRVHWDGNLVYLLFDFSTGDAAGQNMVTLATERLSAHLLETTPVRPVSWALESNLSGDKKASVLAFQYVRGHQVIAEVELPKEIVERELHTSPESIERYWRDALVAAAEAGTIGAQGQFANGLAALFLACGQDVACVAEAAVGTSRFETTSRGDLYASVLLPNLVVGTVGGGTRLPTARECLGLLGCLETGSAPRLAEIAAALVLAGEISIAASLACGSFARAHGRFGRPPAAVAGRPR